MSNKMLIDATHPEETRVVVLRGNRVEEFDFESASRKQLRGNIYLAKVTRVEPSLQAAFVDYGGNRHGFLAFSEIHPDYYQIPVADRQALLEDERRAQRDDDDNGGERSEPRRGRGRRHRGRSAGRNRNRDVVKSDTVETQSEPDATDAPPDTGAESIAAVATAPVAPEAVEAAPAEAASENLVSASEQPQVQAEEPSPETRADEPNADESSDHQSEVVSAEAVSKEVASEEVVSKEAASKEAASEEVVSEEAASGEVVSGEDLSGEAVSNDAEAAQQSSIEAEALSGSAPQDIANRDTEEQTEGAGENGDSDDDESEENGDDEEEEAVEFVGGDAIEEVRERAPRYRRHYKIQEVIKRRQVMLVQVVKEERGTKGAALTTYLSLAGRYSVLMPNTARGGGISRKVTNAEDRKHMKEIAEELEVPEGMGVILRTAGASRTKLEIKRDFEYLLRLWETVRDLTLKSTAPTLVYEEGSLVKRSIRDLYHKDIEEIVVEGEAAYREAKDFMRMLMPSAVKSVIAYSDTQPIFTRYGIESQLDAMFQPTVQLKSGGYIVINQTEALVAIDVNSGRATREHSIEETATKTNAEAAMEIARQLRLRDLAGLIVIDFIDMDEGRNNRAVERKMKEALKSDRARIQVGRISHFGLLEMSRQRIRSSVLESSTEVCPHCGGTGHVRAVGSVALQLVRALEETLLKGATHNLTVRARADVAIYVLNHKRAHLRMLEERFKITIAVNVDPSLTSHPAFAIDRGEQVMSLDQAKAIAATIRPDSIPAYATEEEVEADEVLDELETEGEDASSDSAESDEDGRDRGGRRKRRRGRRGRGRDGEGRPQVEGTELAPSQPDGDAIEAAEGEEAEATDSDRESETAGADGDGDKRRRRRGRRGGRRNRKGDETSAHDGESASEGEGDAVATSDSEIRQDDKEPAVMAETAAASNCTAAQIETPSVGDVEAIPVEAATVKAAEPASPEPAAERPARRRSTVREAPPAFTSIDEPAYTPPSPSPSVPLESGETTPEPASDKPRRKGWWSMRG